MSLQLHIGRSLMPPPATGAAQPGHTEAFYRDGRHFLKQLANRIRLKSSQYSLLAWPGRGAQAEVVLRSGPLLVVLEDDKKGARLRIGRCQAGVTMPDDAMRTFQVSKVNSVPVQHALLKMCSTCLVEDAKQRPENAGGAESQVPTP